MKIIAFATLFLIAPCTSLYCHERTNKDVKKETVKKLSKEFLSIAIETAHLDELYDGAKDRFYQARDEAKEGNPELYEKFSTIMQEITQQNHAISDIDECLDKAYKNGNKKFFETLAVKLTLENYAIVSPNEYEEQIISYCKNQELPGCSEMQNALDALANDKNTTKDEVKYIKYLRDLTDQ